MAKQVVDRLIDLLMSRRYNPGDKLPTENELCDMLAVSRPVIREALSSLETMGIVRRKTREGTFFADKIGSKPFSIMLALSAGDIPSIMEARIALELGLVTMAAEKITDAQLGQLGGLLKAMEENEDDYTPIDKEFHRIIALSANNRILEGCVDPLLDMFDDTLGQIPPIDRSFAATLEEHRAIFEALRSRDPVAAYTAMYRHLSHVRDKVMKRLSES
ncbi:FadR/GntR family transcriptional regulator [Paenibacillus hamazuiensis]|uniref:FadR/GntR family transcriptional regulator n=1 Tax=Paenibacillus hamazuiensis TaxID=2936508 RepID=UPI00200D1C5A|nr:FadR/GntR family transcriptional regulator [Paenibacillus hamazuiensis]